MYNLADYINLNKYKNIKLLIDRLDIINIEPLLLLYNKYGYQYFAIIIDEKLFNMYIPKYIFENKKMIRNFKLVYEKYGNNKYVSTFVKLLGENITKVTQYNIDNIFNMFILLYIKKIKGYERWGSGNNKNPETNLINHYKKHVLNTNEGWDKYLENTSVESYRDFAIKFSKIMKNRIIHTNGTKVYFSGIYDKILIIGRLEKFNSENQLGISSCYIISDNNFYKKIKTFEMNACFKLDI